MEKENNHENPLRFKKKKQNYFLTHVEVTEIPNKNSVFANNLETRIL